MAGAPTTVTITATLQTQQVTTQKSANLVVQPPALNAVSVNPSTVTGKTATVQGTVTLTGPAPTGGVSVALSSADPNVVKLQPSNVTVPAGTDLTAYKHVVIWCEQFGVLISPAKLSFKN